MKALILVLLAGLAGAVELQPLPAENLIPPPPKNVKIDGKLDEWDLARAYVVDPTQQPPDQVLVGPGHQLDGAADLSSRILLAWDTTYLYVAARTRDDHLRGIEPGTGHLEGPAGWACDSVMLVVRSNRQPLYRPGPHLPIALRYMVPEGGHGTLLDYKRGTPDNTHLSWKLPKDSMFACTETEDGFAVEAAMPWAELHFKAQAGEPLDIAFLLADMDPEEPLKQLGWHFPQGIRFRLDDGRGTLAVLTIARDQLVAAKEPQAVRWQVDALAGPVQVTGIHVTGELGLDRRVPLAVTVPAGQRGEDLAVIRDLPEALGPAVASLEATIGGTAVTLASAPFTIVAAAPEPPRVSNPLGEIVRQSPERTYHHAVEDRRRAKIRYNYIHDRSGYDRWLLTHVKDYIDAQGANIDSIMGEKGNIWAGSQVLRALALYRLTGDEKYATWTRQFIESQLRYYDAEPDLERRWSRLSSLVWPRYYTWQRDPATPLAPADAEARYAKAWAAIAATPPDIMFQEWGYHNRCWHRWAGATLAIHFAEQIGGPVDPRLREYVQWHDEHLVPFGNTTDNSSGYNWLTPHLFLEVRAAEGTLDSAFTDNPGMLVTVERLRDYFAPNGVIPNWGDTSGWMTGASHGMSLMELLGHLTGDGRFRFVGQRTAEYLYNFMWANPDQYHMVKDSVADAFAMAWLAADDAVPPRGLTGASIITHTNRTAELTAEEKDARPGLGFGKLVEDIVADKAILKSGYDPFGLWAFVELRDTAGHSGVLPGNVATILANSAVLYGGQGYWDTGQGDNNVVWVEDLEGVAAAGASVRTEVPAFADDGAFTWLRVRTRRYAALPITATRDILFVKNGAIVVRDRLDYHATMKLRVGPCWHTRKLGPQCGEDWFNTYYEKLYSTGLGVGRGVHVFPNPAWDMLVAYAPRGDCRITVTDRYDDNPWRVSPLRLQQWWSGIVEAGESRTFVSVLLPHVATFDATKFRERIEFLVDTPDALLVRLPRCQDARNPLAGNSIVLQVQDGAGTVEADGWRSDARVAMVERQPDGTLRQAILIDGTQLTQAGEDLTGPARRPEVQVVQLAEDAD